MKIPRHIRHRWTAFSFEDDFGLTHQEELEEWRNFSHASGRLASFVSVDAAACFDGVGGWTPRQVCSIITIVIALLFHNWRYSWTKWNYTLDSPSMDTRLEHDCPWKDWSRAEFTIYLPIILQKCKSKKIMSVAIPEWAPPFPPLAPRSGNLAHICRGGCDGGVALWSISGQDTDFFVISLYLFSRVLEQGSLRCSPASHKDLLKGWMLVTDRT